VLKEAGEMQIGVLLIREVVRVLYKGRAVSIGIDQMVVLK
jgi:hypothetical protein